MFKRSQAINFQNLATEKAGAAISSSHFCASRQRYQIGLCHGSEGPQAVCGLQCLWQLVAGGLFGASSALSPAKCSTWRMTSRTSPCQACVSLDRAFEEFLSFEEASHLLSKRLSTRVHKRSCEAWALLGRVDHMCSRAWRAALAPLRFASLDGGAKPACARATVDPARQLVKDIKAKAEVLITWGKSGQVLRPRSRPQRPLCIPKSSSSTGFCRLTCSQRRQIWMKLCNSMASRGQTSLQPSWKLRPQICAKTTCGSSNLWWPKLKRVCWHISAGRRQMRMVRCHITPTLMRAIRGLGSRAASQTAQSAWQDVLSWCAETHVLPPRAQF